jgi:hypothetical protein
MGYDIDENATRFSNYFHVLRELVHLTAGHLALEPRFEVKALLGDHLHDDARAVSKIRRRLAELRDFGGYPGAPSLELAALLDRAHAHDYLEVAYGELKPALVAAIRIHLENLEPLVDEPSLRLLTQLLHRQERHITELPAAREHAAFDDLGALQPRRGETRALTIMPPLEQPARDAFIEITEHGDPAAPEDQKHVFHGLMDAELCAAELTARNSHEHPDMPWDFHVDMARQVWDDIRHAEVLDRLMSEELDCHWGDYPVGFAHFKAIYRLDLPGRLASVSSYQPTAPVEPGQERIARAFEYLVADAAAHADIAARWGALDRTEMSVRSNA